jgi:hypothetical protein
MPSISIVPQGLNQKRHKVMHIHTVFIWFLLTNRVNTAYNALRAYFRALAGFDSRAGTRLTKDD